MIDGEAASRVLPQSLVLVGAGKMGAAMLAGWLGAGLPDGAATVLDPDPSETVARLGREGRIRLNPPEPAGHPDVLVLAIKPQSLEDAAPALRGWTGPASLVVSILAGKTEADLRRALPGAGAIVRAMPNLPASIGRGATGAHAGSGVKPAQRAMAEALLATNGLVVWVETEDGIDAVTALSGSGPAYVFHLVDAMAEAGAAAGLAPDLAMRLARSTVTGAAFLLESEPDRPASDLRQAVTSKGGTTAAALDVLMASDGLGPLMIRTVEAAKRRARELSG